MSKPWYAYPRIDNFGQYPDPVGLYAKPDSNIDCPPGTPITALASGTVSGARLQPWGPLAWSITVKLDQPVNAVATHMAYNYVSNPKVSVGQRVSEGEELAQAGNPYGIGTAFALCDSDLYGTPTKNSPFRGRYINPALNPVPFLDSLPGSQESTPARPQTNNILAKIAETVLSEVGVPSTLVGVINPNALTWIGAGIVGAAGLLAAGILFLFTGGL